MSSPDLIVIGGGAAGFFGAIAAAAQGKRVMILEAATKVLGKVKISGGGRCNVTHACFEPNLLIQNYPRGATALRGAFSRFQPQHTVAWFQEQGVTLKTEADGRMFPVSDDAETIVQCLISRAGRLGIDIKTGVMVRSLQQEQGFAVHLQGGELLRCSQLLLATGSHPSGYKIAAELGHEIIKPVPSLFTFKVSDPRLTDLAGVSGAAVKIKLLDSKLEQVGAVLITHWGLSGPAVLKLSAWAARILHSQQYQGRLQINWLPRLSDLEVRSRLNSCKLDFPQRFVGSGSPFSEIPKRLWQNLVTVCGVGDRWADISKKQLQQLGTELSQGVYQISGKGVFKEEFVTCGGVSLKEVDFKTMVSRKCPNLYLAGEVLDIDGVTGGFNFQSAWTTGWLAGQAIASAKP